MENEEKKKVNIYKKWWFWTIIIVVLIAIVVVILFMNKTPLSVSNNSLNNSRDELLTVLNKNLSKEDERLNDFKEVEGNKYAKENDLKLYETLLDEDVVIQSVEKNGKIQSVRTYLFIDGENSKATSNNAGYIIGVIIRELGTPESESNKIMKDLSSNYTNSRADSNKFTVIMQTTDYYATLLIIFNKDEVDLLKNINAKETTDKLNKLKQEDIINTFNDSIKEIDKLVKNENNLVKDLKAYNATLKELRTKLEEMLKEYDLKNEYPKIDAEKENWFKTIDELISFVDEKMKVEIPDFNTMNSKEAEKWGKDNETQVTTSSQYSDTVANGEIISQSINAGEKIIKGSSTIKVIYSIGRKPTTSELNALKKAQSYSDYQHMSKNRLYKQLTSSYGEGFAESEAQYAIEHVNADWNYNALQKAKSYQSSMNMSKNRIYQQLVSSYGEDFSASEAQYAIDHLDD